MQVYWHLNGGSVCLTYTLLEHLALGQADCSGFLVVVRVPGFVITESGWVYNVSSAEAEANFHCHIGCDFHKSYILEHWLSRSSQVNVKQDCLRPRPLTTERERWWSDVLIDKYNQQCRLLANYKNVHKVCMHNKGKQFVDFKACFSLLSR